MNRNLVILFVCTGNICRSPMAEGILKDMLLDEVEKNHQILPIEVMSAGIFAADSEPASRYSREISARHGISLDFHRSRQLTEQLANYADLILTMEYIHTEYIRHAWPHVDYVYEIKQYGRSVGSAEYADGIADPMGFGPDTYEAVFTDLKREIERILPTIIPLAKEKYSAW